MRSSGSFRDSLVGNYFPLTAAAAPRTASETVVPTISVQAASLDSPPNSRARELYLKAKREIEAKLKHKYTGTEKVRRCRFLNKPASLISSVAGKEPYHALASREGPGNGPSISR